MKAARVFQETIYENIAMARQLVGIADTACFILAIR